MLLLLLVPLLSGCTVTSALEVSFSSNYSTYVVTHGPAKTKLFSADAGLAVFVDGRWHSQAEGTLKMEGAAKPVQGTHAALGAFKGIELGWMAGTTPLITTAKTYAPDTVTFEYSFPKGAAGTSLVELAGKTRDEVIVNFPAFTTQSLEGTMYRMTMKKVHTSPNDNIPFAALNNSRLATHNQTLQICHVKTSKV